MVDYGLWFNDSLNVRQGVREAARMGVVENYSTSSCPTAPSDMAKLACIAKDQIGSVAGPSYVKIIVPSTGWKRTEPLTVCAMVAFHGVTGFVPLPNDGLIESKTTMSIEVDVRGDTAGQPDGLQHGADLRIRGGFHRLRLGHGAVRAVRAERVGPLRSGQGGRAIDRWQRHPGGERRHPELSGGSTATTYGSMIVVNTFLYSGGAQVTLQYDSATNVAMPGGIYLSR